MKERLLSLPRELFVLSDNAGRERMKTIIGVDETLFAYNIGKSIEGRNIEMFKVLKEVKVVLPKWLEFDATKLEGKILDLPRRDDIDLTIEEHLIVEHYSR